MKNRNPLFASFLLTVIPLSFQGYASDGLKKPNVVLISVDDLRPALRCYGDTLARTPNIDRLASQGVVFTRAYIQQAVCNPSRASMLTGLRPDQTKVYDLRTHFRQEIPEIVTLPQIFKNNQYESIGIGKIFHRSLRTQDSVSFTRPPLFNIYDGRAGKASSTECVDVDDTYYDDGKITMEAIKALKRFKDKRTPFFLAIGYLKPHLPFYAPKKYWDLYSTDDFQLHGQQNKPINAPGIAFHNWWELRGYNDIPDNGPLPPGKETELRHGYYACVSYIDAQVGIVLDVLENLGLRKNTIVVLWGDHGYHLGDQNIWCKSTNFELATHIPLIVSAPGVSFQRSISSAIVEAVDLYPTLIDLCGIDPEGNISGESLKPLLQNPEQSWKNLAFSQFPRPYGGLNNFGVATHMGYTVRTSEWRFTAWYKIESDSVEFRELYSFDGQNVETENLSDDPLYKDIELEHIELVEKYRQGIY